MSWCHDLCMLLSGETWWCHDLCMLLSGETWWWCHDLCILLSGETWWCHYVMMLWSHDVMMSWSLCSSQERRVNDGMMLWFQDVMMSLCYDVIMLWCHDLCMLLSGDVVMMSWCHEVILSCHDIIGTGIWSFIKQYSALIYWTLLSKWLTDDPYIATCSHVKDSSCGSNEVYYDKCDNILIFWINLNNESDVSGDRDSFDRALCVWIVWTIFLSKNTVIIMINTR